MIQPQIINVVQNLVVRQISPQSTNGLLPTENDLKSALTNNPANWDSFIYQYVIKAIGPVWNTNGSNIQNLILKLFRKPSEIPGFVKKQAVDLPLQDSKGVELSPTVKILEHKVHADEIKNGYLLWEEFMAYGNISHPQTLDDAVKKIMHLRAFEDFLIRIISSEMAALNTGIDLAEVLAFYRVEGDLAVPSSSTTLDSSIPPCDRMIWVNPNLSVPIPNFERVVWLMKKDVFEAFYGEYSQTKGRIWSIIDHFLIITGFDVISDKFSDEDSFANFSSNNWGKIGNDGSLSSARGRYNDLLSNMDILEIDLGGEKILRAAPVDCLKFMSMILTEALIHYKAIIDEKIKYIRYLVYHAGESQYYQILLSAMDAAVSTNDIRYRNIKDALTSVPLSYPNVTYDPKDILTMIESWFDIPNNKIHLEDFISNAGQNHWKYWMQQRANLSRFNVLLDYYKKLIA